MPQDYEGKPFTDVTREDLELDESEEGKQKAADAEAELKDLTAFMAKVGGSGRVCKAGPSAGRTRLRGVGPTDCIRAS